MKKQHFIIGLFISPLVAYISTIAISLLFVAGAAIFFKGGDFIFWYLEDMELRQFLNGMFWVINLICWALWSAMYCDANSKDRKKGLHLTKVTKGDGYCDSCDKSDCDVVSCGKGVVYCEDCSKKMVKLFKKS